MHPLTAGYVSLGTEFYVPDNLNRASALMRSASCRLPGSNWCGPIRCLHWARKSARFVS